MTIQLQPRGRADETRIYTPTPENVKTLCLTCIHCNDDTDAWCSRFAQERDVYNDRIVVVECGGHTPCS